MNLQIAVKIKICLSQSFEKLPHFQNNQKLNNLQSDCHYHEKQKGCALGKSKVIETT